MRSISRTAARIPTLYADNGSGRKKAAALLDLFRREEIQIKPTGSSTINFADHWNKADVRGALYAQQGRACAYCGCELTEGDRGDVEHFRPKGKVAENPLHGGYWWLAYAFDNYVLSCRTCNSRLKGSKFPLCAANDAWVTYETRSMLPEEARLLLDPSADPMEELFHFDWNTCLCPVEPASNLTDEKRQQAQGMIDFFQLNGRVLLMESRQELAQEAFRLIEEDRCEEVGQMAIRYLAHSLVACQVLIDCDRAQYLPGPKREFEWLIGDIFRALRNAMRIPTMQNLDVEAYQPVREHLWSLATLVADQGDSVAENLIRRLIAVNMQDRVIRNMQQMA